MARNFKQFQELLVAITEEKNAEEVDLSDQMLTEDDVISLSGAIIFNRTLRRLNLSNNPLTESGVISFYNALKNNSVIIEIQLESCGLQEGSLKKIEEQLSHNRCLTIGREVRPQEMVDLSTKKRERMRSLIEEVNHLKLIIQIRDRQVEELEQLGRRHSQQIREAIGKTPNEYPMPSFRYFSTVPNAPPFPDEEEIKPGIIYPSLDPLIHVHKRVNVIKSQIRLAAIQNPVTRDQIINLKKEVIEKALERLRRAIDQEEGKLSASEVEDKEKAEKASEKGKGKEREKAVKNKKFHLNEKKHMKLTCLLEECLLKHNEAFPLSEEQYNEIRDELSQLLQRQMKHQPVKKLKKDVRFYRKAVNHVHFEMEKGKKLEESKLQRQIDEVITRTVNRTTSGNRLQAGYNM